VPAVTAAGSLVTALAELGVRRAALASPYEPELHAATVAFLEASGVEVVGSACPDERLTGREQRALTPPEAQALALRADSPAAEAIVVACTDLRSVEAAHAIERAAGKPVVASNRALVETALRRLAVGAGR
jgi:maleate cis-trans isomerase